MSNIFKDQIKLRTEGGLVLPLLFFLSPLISWIVFVYSKVLVSKAARLTQVKWTVDRYLLGRNGPDARIYILPALSLNLIAG